MSEERSQFTDSADGQCLGKCKQDKAYKQLRKWKEEDNLSQHDGKVDETHHVRSSSRAEAPCVPSMPERSPLVESEAMEYNMGHPLRGKCLVFYFSHYSPDLELRKRDCAETDKNNIAKSFGCLGFDVREYHNLKKEDLLGVIRTASEENHSQRDCLAVVFMSHGDFDDLTGKQWLFVYDSKILPEDLWKCFTNPRCSLSGKPKLFFIQACRGNQTDSGVWFIKKQRGVNRALKVETDNTEEFHVLPTDMLIMWASFPGHYAFRSNFNGIKGSVFIFFLSNVLNEKGSKNSLASLLLEVTRKVALKYESCSSVAHINAKKQVPEVESTLVLDLYFRPKNN